MLKQKQKLYCGFISILGKPNVGKSTLLNKLVGKKISITSKKPQTTKFNITGIITKNNYQSIYIDMPGLQSKLHQINVFKNNALFDNVLFINIDLIIMVVDNTGWNKFDEIIINKLCFLQKKVILVINKIDIISDKKKILPYIKYLNSKMNFFHILPISAKKNIGIDLINKIVFQSLPEKNHYFPNNCYTNQSQYVIVTEIIREKFMRFLNKEIPYLITIKLEEFMVNRNGEYFIHVIIFTKKQSHKKIIIGFKGHKIKQISSAARIDMEKYFSAIVNLIIWIKT